MSHKIQPTLKGRDLHKDTKTERWPWCTTTYTEFSAVPQGGPQPVGRGPENSGGCLYKDKNG